MPRLQRGETSPGVMRKSDSCSKSAQLRIAVLIRLLEGDASAMKDVERFQSFSSLCAWEAPEHGIGALSEKTLRSHIGKLYDGGHEKFLADMKSVNNRFPDQVRRQTDSPKHENQARAGAVLALTQQYGDLLERFTKLSQGSEDAKRELTKHFLLFKNVHSAPPHLRRVK